MQKGIWMTLFALQSVLLGQLNLCMPTQLRENNELKFMFLCLVLISLMLVEHCTSIAVLEWERISMLRYVEE